MSHPVSRITHPFDITCRPALEPEVKRAIMASWTSDVSDVPGKPAKRRPGGVDKVMSVDVISGALRALDDIMPGATSH